MIKDIPRSTDYSVTEREDHLYETSIIVNGDEENKISGNSVSQTISNDNKILFHNKKNPSLPFTFTKINAEKTNKVLSGAEFSLYYLSCTDSDPGHTHDKPAETSDCWTLYKTAVSGSDGKVNLGDLSDGTYRLYETKVPDGFCKSCRGWELKVACGETEPLKITGMGTPKPPAFKVEDDGSMKLPNMPLLNPPMSGGKGIFPLYLEESC